MLGKKSPLLCLDVALTATGVAVWSQRKRRFVHFGVIRTEKHHEGYVVNDNVRRGLYIAERLRTIIGWFHPEYCFAELPTGASRSSKSVAQMSFATGIVVATLAALNVNLVTVQPSETKKLVHNTNSASKQEVIKLVLRKFQLHESLALTRGADLEHIADAAALMLVMDDRYGNLL